VAGNYAALVANRSYPLLLEDAFAGGSAARAGGSGSSGAAARAGWGSSGLTLLDGAAWNLSQVTAGGGFEAGVYALYADVDIQARRPESPPCVTACKEAEQICDAVSQLVWPRLP
jgi:hypothetical protein